MIIGTPHQPWELLDTTAEDFLLQMLKYGKPIETSLVGSFDQSGRGSRRDIPLPFHRDGDYSKEKASKNSIDVVGLFCIRGGEANTLIKYKDKITSYNLKKGQGIIFDNKEVLHAREGEVGDRILLRVWVERQEKANQDS